jgi:hypothetical protein
LRTAEIAGPLTGSIVDSKVRKQGWWFGRISGMIACPGQRSSYGARSQCLAAADQANYCCRNGATLAL